MNTTDTKKTMNLILKKINDDVETASNSIPLEEWIWIKKHLDYPHVIEAFTDIDQVSKIKIWQITKNINDEKESYNIAYNPSTKNYGIITQISPDIKWYMGDYGTLYETFLSL